jgi:hypothetical protein
MTQPLAACTDCGAILGGDYTTDDYGAYCTNCRNHPDSPATGVRVYELEDWR